MKLTAIIYPDSKTDWLVAACPEIGTASQGRTEEKALGTLRSALKMAGVSPEEFSEAL